jgi:hypothetical protein
MKAKKGHNDDMTVWPVNKLMEYAYSPLLSRRAKKHQGEGMSEDPKLEILRNRYGDDFTDMISMAVELYNDPEQPEVPDFVLDDPDVPVPPDGWNLLNFLQCLGDVKTTPVLQHILGQLRGHEWHFIENVNPSLYVPPGDHQH